MKHAFLYLSGLVGLGVMVYLAAQIQAQAPNQANPATARPGKPPALNVAVFNVAKVMKDYQKWNHFANVMKTKEMSAFGELSKERQEIVTMQEQIQKETITLKKEEIANKLVAKQRSFEDRERQIRKVLDDESAGHIRGLFNEIQACVKAIVDANGYEIVLSYPDVMPVDEATQSLYYDLRIRNRAAMPFYVDPRCDVTETLIQTLNKHFPPVTQTGAIQPAGGNTAPKQ